MSDLLRLGFVGAVVLSASIIAASPSAGGTKSPTKAVKPMQITCEEFLSFDEATRPQIVYWSEEFIHQGRPEDTLIDVDQANSLVPVLVEDCRRTPHASFWTKLKEETKKHV